MRRQSAALILLLPLLAALPARAQVQTSPGALRPQLPSFGTPYASVTIIVTDVHGQNLGEQALVKLYSDMNGTNVWGTTQDRSQIIFDDVPPDDYQVEVSAAGYISTTQAVNVMAASENYDVIVRLKRDEGAAVLPPVPGQMLAGRTRKEVQKGIEALTKGDLKSAHKHLDKAHKMDSGNADIDYLLGLLSMREGDTNQAGAYLKAAIAVDKKHVRALTMLGELMLQQKDYKDASARLEQAVTYEPEFWTAHWLLSEAYLRSGDFEKSRQQAELAIDKGKGAATAAELVLGEALANLGRREDAIQALQKFLQESPGSSQAEPVRKLIAQLQSAETAHQEGSPLMPRVVPSALPITSPPDAGLSIPTWHPPSVDDEKLAIATGAVCPVSQVIHGAGRSAERLVKDVGSFEATEDVVDQQLDSSGKPLTTEKRKFDYIASIAEVHPPALKVDESRTSFSGQGDVPGHIAARGLVALALVFHPLLRDDYNMTCEGLGAWNGSATWLVYFRQRPDRPERLLQYSFTDASYPVALKGRAWIAADTFQIIHLEADLLHPMPEIQLTRQHQSVDYGPVSFRTSKVQLWLPKTAELYFDFRRHHYYRRDSFDQYKLFAVGASERIGQPKVPDQTPSPQQ